MSEVHVYGVLPASARPELTVESVRQIPHRKIAALVSDIDRGDLSAVRVLRAHWRVLEEVAASTTILPVRFGTVMADDRAVVEAFLGPAYDELAASLQEMDGMVQLTVKGTYDETALMAGVVKRSPAIARLRKQVAGVPESAAYYKQIELGQLVAAEVERARDRDAQEVMDRLEPFATAARREPPATLDAALNLAFLVDRRDIDRFSRAVAELRRELAGQIELRYVGPLPPYSFTGDRAVTTAET
jgi:gas vesicle protein GvpL/GvpF